MDMVDGSGHGHQPAHAGQQQPRASPAVPLGKTNNIYTAAPTHWSTRRECAPPTLCPRTRTTNQPATTWRQHVCVSPHPAPTPIPYFGGGAASWYQPSGTTPSSAYNTASPWHQQCEQQLIVEQRGRAEAQQQLIQCQQIMAAMQRQMATMSASTIKQQRHQKRAARRSASPSSSSGRRKHRSASRRSSIESTRLINSRGHWGQRQQQRVE